MEKFYTADDRVELIKALLVGKSDADQAATLYSIVSDIFDHGWFDEELADTILDSIARQYSLPYKTSEEMFYEEEENQ